MSSGAWISEQQRARQPWIVLSAAQSFSLAASPHPAISHFYSLEVGCKHKDVVAIPDGCVDILFDCDAQHPGAEVYGTPKHALEIQLETGHRYFGVRFSPGVIPACFQVAAEELVEQHYDLQAVIPHAEPLFEWITQEAQFARQIEIFHDFFANRQARPLSPLTRWVAREIANHRGKLPMQALESLTGYSLRSIQRQFKAEMGVSPKTYSRILRCQSAVHQINYQNITHFADLACDLGFTDQPHFLREFKQMVSTTPGNYQRQIQSQGYAQRINFC